LFPPATPLKEASKKSRGYSNCGSWASVPSQAIADGLRQITPEYAEAWFRLCIESLH
jgi:hypothetical protein